MNVSFIGSGYVGQVNAVGAAFYGHDVVLVDVEKEKVDSINNGIPTIYEKELEDHLKTAIKQGKLYATLDLRKAVQETQISLICVGTPDKGSMIDLSFIQEVAKGIGETLKTKEEFHVVVVKSTVVPGTTLKTVLPIIEQYSGKKANVDFGIAMNPEFLREGVAWEDSVRPDSIVLGTQDEKTKGLLRQMYDWADEKVFTYVSITAAEAIKYAKNSFLAMKITFANEWGNFCDKMGIDAKEVLEALGADRRISPMFLRNGPGYGGSCFPKDVNAIVHAAQVNHSPFRILEEVVQVNRTQYLQLIDLAQTKMGPILRRTVGVLGLSFKPDTDDTRESPALRMIAYLVSQGCKIKAFCPQGMKMARKWFDKNRITADEVQYTNTARECTEGVEFVMIPTDWPEFREIVPSIKVPTFVGHRSFIDPSIYPHVYALGHPKR